MNIFEKLRWFRQLIRLYPNRDAFNTNVEKAVIASANAFKSGYCDGYERGKGDGYGEGFSDCLARAKQEFELEFNKPMSGAQVARMRRVQ